MNKEKIIKILKLIFCLYVGTMLFLIYRQTTFANSCLGYWHRDTIEETNKGIKDIKSDLYYIQNDLNRMQKQRSFY